jgi:ABC-2 type transport system permease protein
MSYPAATPYPEKSYAVSDSLTMLRRNLRHALRYPSMTVGVLATPVLMMLLFVYVFGNAIGTGISGGSPSGVSYINYIVPGMLMMTLGSGSVPTAVAVCSDMTQGIVARFRTMAISRTSVLTGHVVGSVIQTMVSVGLVLGVGVLMGFRPTANFGAWMAVIAIIAMVAFAMTWLAVGLGLMSKNVEGASNIVLPFSFLLPFLSSAFVPLSSMPGWIRWFAEYQPFTAITEALRGLLLGTPVGNNVIIAAAWCVGLTVICYLWSKKLYNRDPAK